MLRGKLRCNHICVVARILYVPNCKCTKPNLSNNCTFRYVISGGLFKVENCGFTEESWTQDGFQCLVLVYVTCYCHKGRSHMLETRFTVLQFSESLWQKQVKSYEPSCKVFWNIKVVANRTFFLPPTTLPKWHWDRINYFHLWLWERTVIIHIATKGHQSENGNVIVLCGKDMTAGVTFLFLPVSSCYFSSDPSVFFITSSSFLFLPTTLSPEHLCSVFSRSTAEYLYQDIRIIATFFQQLGEECICVRDKTEEWRRRREQLR